MIDNFDVLDVKQGVPRALQSRLHMQKALIIAPTHESYVEEWL